jgi:hypothetical protein
MTINLNRFLNLIEAFYSRFAAGRARGVAGRGRFLPVGLADVLGLISILGIKI